MKRYVIVYEIFDTGNVRLSDYAEESGAGPDVLRIFFAFDCRYAPPEPHRHFREKVARLNLDWLKSHECGWLIDFSRLARAFPGLSKLEHLRKAKQYRVAAIPTAITGVFGDELSRHAMQLSNINSDYLTTVLDPVTVWREHQKRVAAM